MPTNRPLDARQVDAFTADFLELIARQLADPSKEGACEVMHALIHCFRTMLAAFPAEQQPLVIERAQIALAVPLAA